MFPCYARLGSTKSVFLGNSQVLVRGPRLCENKVDTQDTLCSSCKELSSSVKPSQRVIHGKVSEPIPPDSHIFGSTWYSTMLAKHGPTKDTKWLAEVIRIQGIIEKDYHGHIEMGLVREPVLSQPVLNQPVVNQPVVNQPVVNQPVKVRKPRKPKKVESVPTSIIPYITPAKRKYVEAEGPVSMLPTDEYSLSVEVVNGEEVYVCENGMVFRIIQHEPGAFIGWWKNGSFRTV